MDNIKDYREKELKMYIILNIVILIMQLGIFDIHNIMSSEDSWIVLFIRIIDSTLISSSIYVSAFLVDSLFDSALKYKLVYLFGHLPGETIFSSLKIKGDIRFSNDKIFIRYKEIYDQLPTNMKERYKYENDKWYEIYSKHRDKQMILISNRDYLLCRDLYIMTLVILCSYIFLVICFKQISLKWNGILYLVTMLIITNFATRVKGTRFVRNVIAYDINNFEKIQE